MPSIRACVNLLLVAALVTIVAAPVGAFPNRRVYEFYAYTYGNGDPVHNSVCPCQIGPCPPVYEVVGGYTVECDGTRTDEWGYTSWNGQCGYQNHPVDRVLVSSESCPF
ncbi:MAG TPA: hypothetical protein VF266_10450 [Thermoanaerobaculia bacterium]